MKFALPADPRYGIVACAFLIQAVMVGSMFAYGVFFKALEDELGWSRTLLSACFSVSFMMMGIFGIVFGRLSDRLGPRIVMSISAVCFSLGYILMYFMHAPWMLILAYGVFVGMGMASHDVVTLSTVARWFDRRRGLMTAITKIGTACGQVVIPLLASLFIVWFGWRTACIAIGLIALVLLLAAAQGLRRNPTSTTSGAGASTAVAPEAGVSFTAASRSRAFWTFCGTQFCFIPCLVTVPVHIVPHAVDLGMSTTKAAALLSVIGGASIIGRLLAGVCADRFGGRITMLGLFSVLFASMVLLRLNEGAAMLFVFAAIYGMSHGGFFTVVALVLAEYFGTLSHGAIFGAVLFSGTLGGALGPLLAGHAFDTQGSYDLAFTTLAGLVFVGLMLAVSLRPSVKLAA